jgi:hypothetical protein
MRLPAVVFLLELRSLHARGYQVADKPVNVDTFI